MRAAEPIAPLSESTWPGWLRRQSGVELLGPPRLFFAWVTIALSLLAILYVGAWNAAKYPVPLGYDAQGHVDYTHVLLREHHIPTSTQSAESNQPPLYYAVAGAAAIVGHTVFGWSEDRPYSQLPEISYRGAQILNVLFVLLTALCVLWLARIVAPRSPWVWASAVGYFAFLPVVAKTMAMFHPDNLGMLASAAAVAAATHILARRTFERRYLLLLSLSLAVGLATRASTIFTLIALAVGFAFAGRDLRRRVPWRAVGKVAAVAACLVIPWIAYRAIVHHAGPLNATTHVIDAALHPSAPQNDTLANRAPYFHISARSVFETPWRSHYANQAFTQTYTEIWGDWLGQYAWSSYSLIPTGPAQKLLRDQSYIGAIPTALAIAGWLFLAWLALRKRRDLLVLAVLPAFAVGGYFYRGWILLTRDGDLFKATYVLTSAPVWALGFGLATAWLASRSRLARYGMIVLFAVFAVLELRFTMYGIRDHRPIF